MTHLAAGLVLVACLAMPAAADERTARTNYILRCAGCHGMTGLGTPSGEVPPFPDSVGHIARSEIGRTYMMHVPGVVSASLSNAEIAEVLNYVLNTWATDAPPYTADEVTRRRALPVPDVVAYRRDVVESLRADGIEIAPYPWP